MESVTAPRAEIMPMLWPKRFDPSVRTRHLTVVVALSLSLLAVLAGFSISRLLNARIAAKHKASAQLADALYEIAQQAILLSPQLNARQVLRQDPKVKELVEDAAGVEGDFTYCALVSVDNVLLVQSDLRALRDQRERIQTVERIQNAVWPLQLLLLARGDRIYEYRTTLKLSNQPFAEIRAGVTVADLRRDLGAPAQLTLIFTLALAGFAVLLAAFSSQFVLRPLSEVIASIEQLEAESAGPDSKAPVENVEAHNITQRLRVLGRRFAGSRTELEAIRDQLRQVVGSLTERVILLDREQRVLLASPEAERLLANGHGPLRGRLLADAIGNEHPVARLVARGFADGESRQDLTIIPETRPDSGTDRESEPQAVAASLQLFKDHGRPAGALLTLRDFEALQRLESQLDFATKLAAMNRITAGVAHEVKNPLHAMVLHLELLETKLTSGANPRPHVEILLSEVNRLNRVVQTFLDFTRPVELTPFAADANELVRGVIPLAGDVTASNVEITTHLAPEPLQIKVDADLIKQALLNIVINGVQAMPGGGRLTIETRRTAEGRVEIAVCDEGPGIPPELREKIFNLYFTTKPQGSGIGLAQAFRALQLHNGQIRVESEPGHGACFRLILPAA